MVSIITSQFHKESEFDLTNEKTLFHQITPQHPFEMGNLKSISCSVGI